MLVKMIDGTQLNKSVKGNFCHKSTEFPLKRKSIGYITPHVQDRGGETSSSVSSKENITFKVQC